MGKTATNIMKMNVRTALLNGLRHVANISSATLTYGSQSCEVYKSFGPQQEYTMLGGGYEENIPDLSVMAEVDDILDWGLLPNSVVELDGVSYSVANPITKTVLYWWIPLRKRK